MTEPKLESALEPYRRVLEATGGAVGVRGLGSPLSAPAQPRMTFAGRELYPAPVAKAAAPGFSLVKNHPFLDGNERMGLAAMDAFLRLNGRRIVGDVDAVQSVILLLAAGELSR